MAGPRWLSCPRCGHIGRGLGIEQAFPGVVQPAFRVAGEDDCPPQPTPGRLALPLSLDAPVLTASAGPLGQAALDPRFQQQVVAHTAEFDTCRSAPHLTSGRRRMLCDMSHFAA